ncbi:MAG: Glu/Leu/Phe/Val family dehydrogenase [Candidatus Woesearchaeota archaeon]
MSSFDDIGPEVVLHLYDSATSLRAVIVLDNTRRGPAKGGIRMTSSVDEQEVRELARAMTLKNALANLPFGGGKSGIVANPKDFSSDEKRLLVESFARRLSLIAPKHYIAAPDIAMGSEDMRVIAGVAGKKSVTGKPVDIGGLSGKEESTGFGVFVATKEVLLLNDQSLEGVRVAIQGFGNVGSFAARFLEQAGAVIVAVSDSSATIVNQEGFVVDDLVSFKEGGGRFSDYDAETQEASSVLFLDCDVLIPAAQARVVAEENVSQLQAKYIVQGANLPVTESAERLLEQRGVVIVPDILANAGGVIASWCEHEGLSSEEMFSEIEQRISANVSELSDVFTSSACARDACVLLAKKRLD